MLLIEQKQRQEAKLKWEGNAAMYGLPIPIGQMNPEAITQIESSGGPVFDRWRRWSGQSAGVHFGGLLFYPMLICGCHFHLLAMLVGFVPVLWGGFTLANYATTGERIIGYINAILSIGWLYIAWDSNVQFLLR